MAQQFLTEGAINFYEDGKQGELKRTLDFISWENMGNAWRQQMHIPYWENNKKE